MLCSISTGKSGSNWLDRLRSSKGFPAGNDLDLEQFLTYQNSNLPNSSDTKSTDSTTNNIDPKLHDNSIQSDLKQTTEIPRENGEEEWFGIMNNVLAELFYMGDSNDFSRNSGKKCSRKQPNPKICVLSKSPDVGDMLDGDARRDEGVSATLPSSDGNGNSRDRMKLAERENFNVASVDGEEEGKCRADLSAFSCTEVTVIDTSCPSWKFEKMLFRRKNVWKVRDKKCKAIDIGRKKRKSSPLNENAGGEKKPKLFIRKGNLSMEANGEEGNLPLQEEHDQSDKMEGACKETQDTLSQVLKKRFPRKLKKGGSSVILIKSIPTSKKAAACIPKIYMKSTQRQYKA